MSAWRIVSLWGPVVAYMAAIFLASAQSSLPVAQEFWDKGLHTAAYALFGVLCLRAFHGGLRRLRFGATTAALAWSLVYALLDEWHQSFVPGRFPSSLDWVADAVGTALAIPVVALLTWLGRWTGGRTAGNESSETMERQQ